MKRNIFVVFEDGRHLAWGSPELFNPHEIGDGIDHTEDDLIQGIDEKQMSSDKLLATKFLTFLGNHRITLEELKLLPKEEQQRLKQEFLENN